MLVILACAFPALVIAAILTLVPVPKPRSEKMSAGRDAPRYAYRELVTYRLQYFLLTLVVTALLAPLQHWLLVTAAGDAAVFSKRATDLFVFALTPSFFVAMVVASPAWLRFTEWRVGATLEEIRDRPDRDRIPVPDSDLRAFPALSTFIAIGSTILNLAFYDTFVKVSGPELLHSDLSSPVTHRHLIADIEELVVHSKRIAPNGNVRPRAWLLIRLSDGETIDTYDLIEEEDLPQLAAALEGHPDFRARRTTAD